MNYLFFVFHNVKKQHFLGSMSENETFSYLRKFSFHVLYFSFGSISARSKINLKNHGINFSYIAHENYGR